MWIIDLLIFLYVLYFFVISNDRATFTLDLLLPVYILKLDRSRVCGFDRQVALVAFMYKKVN